MSLDKTPRERELYVFYMQFISNNNPIPQNIITRFRNDVLRLKAQNLKYYGQSSFHDQAQNQNN